MIIFSAKLLRILQQEIMTVPKIGKNYHVNHAGSKLKLHHVGTAIKYYISTNFTDVEFLEKRKSILDFRKWDL